MELEDKILGQLKQGMSKEDHLLDKSILEKINKIVVFESVKICENGKLLSDSINYIENKVFDYFNNK